VKGLIEIFYEPGKVFDYVRERGAWLAPFIAGLVLTAVTFAYVYQAIGGSNIVRRQLESNRFAQNMPADAKEKAIADADSPAAAYRQAGFAAIGYAIFMAFLALLVLAISAVFGGKLKFPQALGVVSYASWPFSVVRTILSLVVLAMAPDKADLDPQRLLAFNIGAFLDKASTAKPLYALASAFDLFIFAQIFFAAWGLARVAQISFTKALAGMFAIWVVFTAIGMGLSLIF
jgi:hypothetical protein